MKDEHPGRRIEVWFQDEARVGQQGTLTNVWATKGSRPTAIKQTEYDWVYLFGAVNPVTGDSAAIITPTVNTHYMNAHLLAISQQVGDEAHAVLVLDNAGWHLAKGLKVPGNLTLLYLPPYSPELNPVECLWAYLKSHYLANRVFKDYDELMNQSTLAWNKVTPELFRSICQCSWLTHESQT